MYCVDANGPMVPSAADAAVLLYCSALLLLVFPSSPSFPPSRLIIGMS